MKILLTNIWLENHAGTEIGIREMAIEYHKRGHQVQVYSPILGKVAEEIRTAGIFITDQVSELIETPDIIHCQHYVSSMNVLLKFRNVPAVYFCRDSTFIGDAPPKLSNVVRYYAVDNKCFQKLVVDYRIPESKAEVMLNWVDMNRFKLKKEVKDVPQKALIFSNYVREDNFYPAIKDACQKANMTLDVMGIGFGTHRSDPENILGNYDIVFAKGKAAMEAMACGAAVIICDFLGLGGMITLDNYSKLRPMNFSYGDVGAIDKSNLILQEIRKFNQADVVAITKKIRKEADFKKYIDNILIEYSKAKEYYDSNKYTIGKNNDEDIIEVFSLQEYFLNLQVNRFSNEIGRLIGVRDKLKRELIHSANKNKDLQNSLAHAQNSLTQVQNSLTQVQKENIERKLIQQNLESRVRDILTSQSHRLGMLLTFPLRKMVDLFK